MTTQVLGSYSFATTPDVAGNLLMVATTTLNNSAINGLPIGNASPSTGAFTTLSSSGATTLNLTSATALNSTIIGNSAAATGQFTTVGVGTAPVATALVNLAAGGLTLAPLQFTSGPVQTTTSAGDLEYDGVNLYGTIDTGSGRGQIPVTQYNHLTGTGGAITTIANFFGTTSNPSLVASAYYEIEVVMFYLKTTAGTVTWTLTNSAAPTSQNILYEMSPVTGIVAPPGGAAQLQGQVYNNTAAAYTVTTASISNNANMYTRFRILLQNGAGTSLKIQATANAGSITPGINSYWFCKRMAAAGVGTFAA